MCSLLEKSCRSLYTLLSLHMISVYYFELWKCCKVEKWLCGALQHSWCLKAVAEVDFRLVRFVLFVSAFSLRNARPGRHSAELQSMWWYWLLSPLLFLSQKLKSALLLWVSRTKPPDPMFPGVSASLAPHTLNWSWHTTRANMSGLTFQPQHLYADFTSAQLDLHFPERKILNLN